MIRQATKTDDQKAATTPASHSSFSSPLSSSNYYFVASINHRSARAFDPPSKGVDLLLQQREEEAGTKSATNTPRQEGRPLPCPERGPSALVETHLRTLLKYFRSGKPPGRAAFSSLMLSGAVRVSGSRKAFGAYRHAFSKAAAENKALFQQLSERNSKAASPGARLGLGEAEWKALLASLPFLDRKLPLPRSTPGSAVSTHSPQLSGSRSIRSLRREASPSPNTRLARSPEKAPCPVCRKATTSAFSLLFGTLR